MKQIDTIERKIKLSDIRPGPYQKRTTFDREKLGELAQTIRGEGLINPPIVTAVNSHYELLAGERRWRASCALIISTEPGMNLERALDEVCMAPPDAGKWPILKRTLMRVQVSQAPAMEQRVLSAVDNLQRDDLDPIDEAHEFEGLLEVMPFKEVIRRTGKRKAYIADRLILLKLAEPAQAAIKRGTIPLGATKRLHALPAAAQIQIVEQMAGRKTKDIERVIELAQTRNGKGNQVKSAEKPAKRDLRQELEELKQITAGLVHQLRYDAKLLARCADALATSDYSLAENAFERANGIEKSIKGKFHARA